MNLFTRIAQHSFSSKSRKHIFGIVIFVFAILPFVTLLFLKSAFEKESINIFSDALSSVLEGQLNTASSQLEMASSDLYSFSSDISLINVGLTQNQDSQQAATAAESTLNHAASLNDNVFSMYLMCKRNKTIYNSTDYQTYSFEQFFDQAWMVQYSPKFNFIQLLDSVRVISTPSRQNKRLISLICKVPFMSSLDYKYLISNIDIDVLGESIVRSRVSGSAFSGAFSNPSLLIYNSRNELIYTQQASFTSLPLSTFSEVLGDGSEPFNAPKVTINEVDYLVVALQDSVTKWTFLQLIPYSNVISKRNSYLLTVGIALMLIYGLLLVAFVIFQNLQKARSTILYGLSSAVEEPQIPYSSYIFRYAQNEKAINTRTSQIMSQSQPVLIEYAVKSLLYHETSDTSGMALRKLLMKQYQILQKPSRKYTVIVAQVEAISPLRIEMQRDTYNQLRHTIEYGCREHFPEDCEAYFVWHNYSYLCCLISLPDNRSDSELDNILSSIAMNIERLITLLSKETAVVGYGNLTSSLEDVSKSYEQANHLIHYKNYHNENTLYSYKDLIENEINIPYDQHKNLVDQIRLGKTDKALRIVESYFSILKAHSEAKLETVQKICINLCKGIFSSVQTTASGLGLEESNSSYDAIDFNQQKENILNAQSIQQLADCVAVYVTDCSDFMTSVNDRKKSSRFDELKSWIDNNFMKDIALSDAASMLGINSSYVTRLLKENTGDTFIAYVNKKRIELAKELLRTTQLSGNEIAVKVGYRYPQNFIRNFQKYTGMTPGNYRSLESNNISDAEETNND